MNDDSRNAAAERRQRIESLFSSLIDEPAHDRPRLLAERCGDDEDLFEEVDRLLRFDDPNWEPPEASTYMDGYFREDDPSNPTFAAGDRIGAYVLGERLGEGGFGVVHQAHQQVPIERDVALKVLKAGMDSLQVIRRFEAERQVLALMDHPNIARVLDAGTTDSGRPYFVMELVDGVPVTTYCDRHKLTVDERIQLLRQAGIALHHAHQRGVIHRDIKPSNVLAATVDGQPTVKIIDFGIARAVQRDSAELPAQTVAGEMMGTPDYMSPEQALGSLDIDVRTDVYSLGVLAYELLTGERPFDLARRRFDGWSEVQRILTEEEPQRASRRVADNTAALDLAARRATDPARLVSRLQGDLDWILTKALEKDASRRYESVLAFTLDLERHVTGHEVTAAPPSRAYRLRKFVRRRRGLVVAVGLILSALVLGSVGTSLALVRARRAERAEAILRRSAEAERDRARRAERTEAESRRVAEIQRDRAQRVARFLRRMFDGVTPDTARGRDTSLLEALMDQAARRLHSEELLDDAGAQWDLALTIGGVYTDLARFEDAQAILAPLAARAHVDSEVDPELRAWALVRSAALADQRGDLERANTDYTRALALVEEFPNIDPAARPVIHAGLGNLARREHRDADALKHHLLAWEFRQSSTDTDAAALLGNIASGLARERRYEEAQARFEEALEIGRAIGPSGVTLVARLLSNRSKMRLESGDLAGAIADFDAVVEAHRNIYGPSHPEWALTLHNRAALLTHAGDLPRAKVAAEEALAARRSLPSGDPESLGDAAATLARILLRLGEAEEALPLAEEATRISERLWRQPHPDRVSHHTLRSQVLSALGRHDAAILAARKAVEVAEGLGPSAAPLQIDSLASLSGAERDGGFSEEASATLLRAVAVHDAANPTSSGLSEARTRLIMGLLIAATPLSAVAAERLAEQSFEERRRTVAPSDWRLASAEALVGEAAVLRLRTNVDLSIADRTRLIATARQRLSSGFDGLLAAANSIPPATRARRLSAVARAHADLCACAPVEGSDPARAAAEWRARAAEFEGPR